VPRPPSHPPWPLIRRDPEGRERTASSWETLTERLIREAQEAGAFDELPGQGRRLTLEDDHYAGDMALTNHVLRNAGAAPPWIEIDKEARQQLQVIEALLERAARSAASAAPRLERELTRLADRYDETVLHLEGLAPTPRQQRTRLDRAALTARLHEALALPPS
jgi:hypothetical protein